MKFTEEQEATDRVAAVREMEEEHRVAMEAAAKEIAEIKERAAKRISTLEAMVRGQASVMAKLMGEG